MLKEAAESIWQQSNEPLRGLAGSLKSQYEERYDLAPELLDNCFHGLESRLDRFTLPAVKDATRRGECLKRGADRVGETFFNDYYVNSGKADKLDEIRNWQRRVRLRVRADIAGKGRGLLIAWVYGWLSEEGAQ